MSELQKYLTAQGVRFFSADELTYLRRLDAHETPPVQLWPGIIPTALLADRIREKWGGPIRVVSCYRPVSYNRLVGSSDTSQHVRFRAMDIAPVRGDMAAFRALFAEEVDATRKAGQSIGLGHYRTFCHIDSARSRTWSAL